MRNTFCCKDNRSECVYMRLKEQNASEEKEIQLPDIIESLNLSGFCLTDRMKAAAPMISKSAAEVTTQCNCANNYKTNHKKVLTTKRKKFAAQCCDLVEEDCVNQMADDDAGYNVKLRKRCTRATLRQRLLAIAFIILTFGQRSQALLIDQPTIVGLANESNNNDNAMYNSSSSGIGGSNRGKSITAAGDGISSSGNIVSSVSANGYLDKLDNLERSVAAVLIKVAYGTTSTTKRSIPDNSYVPSLTTVATPLLTTLRYLDKSLHQQQQLNVHHHYELDLERDHALPTSAPNADILKSNSNPTYPNPNRHHSHDRERDRHRHPYNTTHLPSLPNLLKKSNSQLPTVPMYPGDIPSYSPPSRSFFTPPLPPEYQNPFADKPTLRGTNNEGMVPNTGTYIHRRPIPPPSLMPGHERIPFRPPDLAASIGNGNSTTAISAISDTKKLMTTIASGTQEADRKKALNTPSRINDASEIKNKFHDVNGNPNHQDQATLGNGGDETATNKRQEVLPSIRRILSGSNGKKGDIPEVLLKQVTTRPIVSYHQPPSSPVVLIEHPAQHNDYNEDGNGAGAGTANSPNINKSKQNNPYDNAENAETQTKTKMSTKAATTSDNGAGVSVAISSTPSAAAAIGEAAATSSYATISSTNVKNEPTLATGSAASAGSSAAAAAAAAHATWTIAWNIHVYLSVILFTILAVYSLYKMLTYNKLTHLFSQSYFHCIHLILIVICTTRISYLCYDAYNIHASFHIFVAELLLNLPATFLTVSFSVLILFLFLKSLNHKNNRYSALIRPLTVIVGCGVHVVLCITLHYVESYTLQNQHLYYQQQQQQQYYRRQQQQQQHQQYTGTSVHATLLPATSLATPPAPPRVLTLICQIIYIFVCLSLGLLYLYLYRILKRILRSKSQNYIHGYQNLSYAIHITIATALLFVLLAAVQIFGAISISTARPLISQGTAEIDWLQWGYQFSLRLIEIAIITLISWVTGLKISSGGSANIVNGDMRVGPPGVQVGGGGGVFGAGGANSAINNREKHGGGGGAHHHHSNVANFFLPCTSSSSQEQFDTDYPAICNANTNLHTYTMRTGKLIYDDSYQLNALGPGSGQPVQQPAGRHCAEYQLQQPTYQRPYDTGSMHSAVNHNLSEYSGQGTLPNHRYHQLTHDQHHHYQDYMTDATTDHYENPNFDLRGSSSGAGSARSAEAHNAHNPLQKCGKNSASCSTTALSSGGSGGSSAASQQQMLLLQSDSCYSEPLQENSSYEFNNFERPNFGNNSNKQQQLTNGGGVDCWSDKHSMAANKARERKSHMTLDRGGYENPERRSSNSTNSCTSTGGGGGGGRYASYNSFDRGYYNGGVRKSGTLNNIVNSNPMHGRTIAAAAGAGTVNSGAGVASAAQRASGVQTLAMTERQHCLQRVGGARNAAAVAAAAAGRGTSATVHDQMFVVEPPQQQQQHLQQKRQQHNNSDEDEDDDDMISVSNVECTNLINNEFGSSCLTNDSNSTASAAANVNLNVNVNADAGVNQNDQLGIGAAAAANNMNKTERLRPNLPALQNVKSQQQKLLLSKHSHASSPHVQSNPIATHQQQQQLQQQQQQHTEHDTGSPVSSNSNSNSASASCSSASESMLVTEQGFLRFRALDDINNAQGVGIHNASIRKQSRVPASAISTNGINC